MSRRVFLFVAALAFCFSAASAGAPMVAERPVPLACGSALLMEVESGQVIFAVNADERRPVASVTKVMTILLALEALEEGRASLDDAVTVSADASGMGGSQILLDTGEQQTYSQLLKSVIVASANDSAVALAEYLYGSESLFVEYMNERASELGMSGTRFVNCTGLPAEGQYTTAGDVALMAAEMFSHDIYFTFSGIWLEDFDHFDGRVTQLTNTNKLIRIYDGCVGGKTGSTSEAGYCIAAAAKRGGMTLVAVVLGAPTSADRFGDAEEMFDYGFANFRLYPVAERGARVRGEMPVTGGDKDAVTLSIDDALTLLIFKGGEQSIELVPKLPETLPAPVDIGQIVGSVDVVMEGQIVASLPIISNDAVKSTYLGNVLRRILANWSL